MKKMWTKWLTVCLISSMALTGCSSNNANTKSGKGEVAEVTYTEVGTYPIANEKITMSMFLRNEPTITDLATNDFTKFMEEKTNVIWKFETAPPDAVTEKVNLLMASGNAPDVFMGDTPDEAKYGVKEGMLLAIEDLIPANMPNYMKAIEELPAIKGQTTATDGHIYNLSNINQCYHCTYAQKYWVNTMWLEKIGMEMPTTTEEFKEVCKKYMEVNPAGIALVGSKDGWYGEITPFLVNAFILDPGTKIKMVLNPEGKVDNIANKEEYKEALKFMKELYDMGAIYEGSFTQTAGQCTSLVAQEGEPVLFTPNGASVNIIDATANQEVYSHYRAIAPLEGPNGVRQATFFKHSGVGSTGMVLTKNCKYPEAALRWADYLYSLEGALTSQFGMEGRDWKYAEAGQVGLDGNPALYEVLTPYSSEPQNADWQDLTVNLRSSAMRFGQVGGENVDIGKAEGVETLMLKETKEKYEPYAQPEGSYDIAPRIKLTAEEASDIQTIQVELEKYIEESRVAFITGIKDIDKDWESYVQGLDKLQLNKFLEVQQAAYDRQYGNK